MRPRIHDLKFRRLPQRASNSIQLLAICSGALLFAVPGKPEKFIHGANKATCKADNPNPQWLEVKPLRILSPPTFRTHGKDFVEPITGYQGREQINRPDKQRLSLIGTGGIERQESYYHSPLFYFLEQKVNSIQRKPRYSQDNLISKALDHGSTGLNEYVHKATKTRQPYFFARYVERSPITFIVFNTPRDDDNKCESTEISILHRGPGLKWGKAWSTTITRKDIEYLFHPKLKTLISRHAPNGIKKHYFSLESSQGLVVALSPADPPLWIRLPALIIIVISTLNVSRGIIGRSRKEAKRPQQKTTTRLLLINTATLAGMAVISATVLDFLLANTHLLNNIDWYLPPKDLIISKRHLEARQQQTNKYGFADRVISDYDIESACKIAVLGDSFIWGWGTRPNSDEGWSRQLESMIPNCRIFHWGQGGWSSNDQARFMEEKGHRHHVDLVLLGFVDNDLSFEEKKLKEDKRSIQRLIASLKGSPMAVVFTPWDGRNEQEEKFLYAKRLFKAHQIQTKDCLPQVQEVTGENTPAPRWMWSGNHVDSHPGYPITKAIAYCAKEFLQEEVFPKLNLN